MPYCQNFTGMACDFIVGEALSYTPISIQTRRRCGYSSHTCGIYVNGWGKSAGISNQLLMFAKESPVALRHAIVPPNAASGSFATARLTSPEMVPPASRKSHARCRAGGREPRRRCVPGTRRGCRGRSVGYRRGRAPK